MKQIANELWSKFWSGTTWMFWDDGLGMINVRAMVAILVCVVVILFGLLAPRLSSGPCSWSTTSFECRDSRVEQCVNSERYNRDECIVLIGGG